MDFLPIFVATKGRKVVIVGDGQMADAKCRGVLKTQADIAVFANAPSDEIRSWGQEGLITLNTGLPCAADFTGVTLVYSAHHDDAVNDVVAELARAQGAMVNVLDRTDACDFITPAIVDRDPVVVAIGTEGTAPVLARQLKSDVESQLPTRLGEMARFAQAFRSKVRVLPEGLARRQFWKAFFSVDRLTGVNTATEVKQDLETLLATHLDRGREPGSVVFVGAGPGDPELLTLKARRLLHDAEVIVYDRLVGGAVLELARREAKFINVGKKGFGEHVTQADINEVLLAEANSGAKVVRLKGGDPSIFGRLDEELAVLHNAGIETLVVPGVTSASAAAASLKFSLTRRNRNSSITLMTAHDAKGYADHDWRQLVQSGQALAIYMGRRASKFLQGRLMMAGADSNLVITCIENISRGNERRFVSTLAEFAQTLEHNEWNGPLIILVGIGDRESVQPLTGLNDLMEASDGRY
ncbi:siroheme synthase CysG [Luminiphilus sp.]|nr:siroheme synthase CysG [Luminiphilus sp.]